MVYVLPQVQVFQEIDIVPAASIQPLSAHISGGHAKLLRYAEDDEKVLSLLGQYDETDDTDYAWPERPAGAIVDPAYTKIRIDNALLRYFDDAAGAGEAIATVAGSANRVRSSSLVLKTANGVSRSGVFKDRDVAIGDAVKLRAVVGDDVFDLCSYVAGFVPETVAAVVGTDTADDSNANASTQDSDVEQTDGAENCLSLAVQASSYKGAAAGRLSETYTVRVLQSSAGGDLTTALVQLISASGEDDVASFSPAADGVYKEVGDFGLNLRFDVGGTSACSMSAENDDVADDDLIAGQEWEVTVAANYTVATLAGGGTYTGAVDDTYILEVTTGGASGAAKVSVRTTKGRDVSGPTTVTTAVAFAVGSLGVTATFTAATGLVKGDRFYIPVTAAAAGAVKTIVLGHNLPDDVINNGSTDVALALYIRKNIELTANRADEAPLTNWEQSATQITLNSGIYATDESYTDDGEIVPLPVIGACDYSKVYVEARYWLPTLSDAVYGLTDVAELDDAVSGALHPDNPLKWGLFKALQNSNGSEVLYTAVCDPSDPDSWLTVLDLADGRRGIFGMVPLTRNATVLSAFEAHVLAQSAETSNRWRVAWFNGLAKSVKAIVTAANSSDDELVLAVLEDDPHTTGTQYTYLRVPGSNGQFVTNEVAAGDTVRFRFDSDGFGNETYSEFTVDAVVNEDTLRLVTGLDHLVSTPEKVEVWRTLSAAQEAAEQALTGGFSHRRVRWVWPDTIDSDGYADTPGYFLCAALAGLSSAVVPHQGLTMLEIAGFDNVDRTTRVFNRTQLNVMAGGGVWIVTQDPDSGSIFTRHAVTTANTDTLIEREEVIGRNLDSISYAFLDLYAPYIGRANVTDSALAVLRTETQSMLKYLTGLNFVPRLGSQLIEGAIRELRAHTVLKDRVVVVLALVLPAPLNNVDAHLTLVASITQ